MHSISSGARQHHLPGQPAALLVELSNRALADGADAFDVLGVLQIASDGGHGLELLSQA